MVVAIWEIEASQTAAKSASCSSFEVVLRFEPELDNICSDVLYRGTRASR